MDTNVGVEVSELRDGIAEANPGELPV